MATIKACWSSLEGGWDWIRDTEPQKIQEIDWLGDWTHQKPGKLEKLIRFKKHLPKPEIIEYEPTKGPLFSLSLAMCSCPLGSCVFSPSQPCGLSGHVATSSRLQAELVLETAGTGLGFETD